MKTTRFFAALLLLLTVGANAAAAEPIKVVTSFSILADLTERIGGPREAWRGGAWWTCGVDDGHRAEEEKGAGPAGAFTDAGCP